MAVGFVGLQPSDASISVCSVCSRYRISNVTICMNIKALWRSRWTGFFARQSNLSEPGLSFVADTPIRTASEDLLGRSSFAAALAKVLYRHRSAESLVVALCGGWGDGKTSIKNLIVEQLKSQPSGAMKVVEFNPWQWGADEAITRAFFREISVALGDVDQSLDGRRRAFEFRRYADILQQFSKGAHAASERAAGWLAGMAYKYWIGHRRSGGYCARPASKASRRYVAHIERHIDAREQNNRMARPRSGGFPTIGFCSCAA